MHNLDFLKYHNSEEHIPPVTDQKRCSDFNKVRSCLDVAILDININEFKV